MRTFMRLSAIFTLAVVTQVDVSSAIGTDTVHLNNQGILKATPEVRKAVVEKKKQEGETAVADKAKEQDPAANQISFNAPGNAVQDQQKILQQFWKDTFAKDTEPGHDDVAAAAEESFPGEEKHTTPLPHDAHHPHRRTNHSNGTVVGGSDPRSSTKKHAHREQSGASVNVDAEEGEPGEAQADQEDAADAADVAAMHSAAPLPVAAPAAKAKDFAFEPMIFVAVGCLTLLLIIVQLAVSCIGAIGRVAPVAPVDGLPHRLKDDHEKFSNIPISARTFRARDGPLQFVRTSLRSVMAQVFVIGPVAAFSIVLGHYENFGSNLSVFFTVFGVCALTSTGVLLVIASLSLCIGACKINKWNTFEKSARNPDQVVWNYASTVAEAKNNPPRCMSLGKQSAMDNDAERMSFLFLRAQVVPLRDYVPNKISQSWEEQFFPRKIDNLERMAHFDLAQYLAVKLTAVWSQLFLFNAWTWLAVGIVLCLGMAGEVLLKGLKLDDTFQAAAKLTFFTVCALFLIAALLAIHFKLRAIKSKQIDKGMNALKAKAEQHSDFFERELLKKSSKPSAEARETHHEIWKEFVNQSSLAAPSLAADVTVQKGCLAKVFPHTQDRAGLWWFGDNGPCYIIGLLQVVLILASILACTFMWHIIPLVATKWGVIVNVIVDVVVVLLLIKLMMWVPNCLFEIVYTGHAGDNFHDPQVAAEIVSCNLVRLHLGAKVVFDSVLLDELALLTESETDPSDTYEELADACFVRLSNGTGRPISLATFAAWYNQSMVRSSLTIPADQIMVMPEGEPQPSELDRDQFVRFYCLAKEKRRELSINFDKFRRAIKNSFETAGQDYLLPEDFMSSLQKHLTEGETSKLSKPERHTNETALLAAAELFDVADLQKVYSVVMDKNVLYMVIRMYLFEFDDGEV